MAGTSLERTIGIGPALEKARHICELSLDEVARDTKLRVDQLAALESEDFEALPSDAFVRGALRTYAQYVGVSPAKVLGAYDQYAREPSAPPPPEGLGRVERAIAATRIRDNQRFLLLGAAVLVALLLIFGLVARDRGAPAPAEIPTTAPAAPSIASTIDAVLVAQRPVAITAVVDGVPEVHQMEEGETLSFSATEELVLTVEDGGAVQVTVAGKDYGAPGEPGEPWTQRYDFDVRQSPGSTTSS
ncbi:MAG TPA: helix-turn-helix domain-containing protein [Actinomycetota bacterium]|nr:helix-turn-helix domain-containing protein [Actinomycetota bacterium]